MKTLLLALSALIALGAGAMSKQRSSGGEFGHSVTTDPESGWKVHTLSFRGSARSATARIVPEAGNNLISLEVNRAEILHAPPKISQAMGYRFGSPILYPTPNRVRDSRFTFDGLTFEFKPNERTHFLHGLVHSVPWNVGPPITGPTSAALASTLEFNERFPHFARFPIRHRLRVQYELVWNGINVYYEVENRDSKRLPFGFGIHPYFNILGDRAQTFIKVPVETHMQAEALLPTGRLEPVAGSRFDIREYASLAKLDLDDVYQGLTPRRAMGYEARDRGIRVTLEASEVFTHAVVYTPPSRPFFCLENQTCSTDAHNLHAKGLTKESHLLVLNPGERSHGWVRIRASKIL